MDERRFYLTTTIPYVNARPHLGFALELVQADVLARHLRLRGVPVRLQTGTDENALKNVLAAEAAGVFDSADSAVLRDVYELLSELRMEHQVEQLREGTPPDNLIDPKRLASLTRSSLKEGFRAVASVQPVPCVSSVSKRLPSSRFTVPDGESSRSTTTGPGACPPFATR